MDNHIPPAIGGTLEVIARSGKTTIVVVPERIWRRLPAARRRRFDDVDAMLSGKAITARLVPLARFDEIRDAVEDLLDAELAESAAAVAKRERADRARLGVEPGIPAAVMRAEIAGAHPIAAWRKHRGMTQLELAAAAGIDRAYLSRLEGGARSGSPETLAAIARALGCLIEDLLEEDAA